MRLRPAAVLLAGAVAFAASGARASRSEDALRESVLRLAAGDVAGAESEARAATAADPSSARALQQLSRAANAALDFAAAQDAADHALTLAAPTPAILCLRSEARAGLGDYAGALADARAAARLNPGSGTAALRSAVAEEGLRRPVAETLSDYRRAAELDVSLSPVRDAAEARLTPPSSRARGSLGGLVGLFTLAAAAGWAWRRLRLAAEAPRAPGRPPAARPALSGTGRLGPREAARALAAAARGAKGEDAALALAESLYERLTGRAPYAGEGAEIERGLGRFAPPSSIVEGLPVGIDAFFARALDPDPERRFRTPSELSGAFRSLVDPSVE